MFNRHYSLIIIILILGIPILSYAECTITFIPESIGYGTIEPSQPITIKPGECAKFKFIPNPNYKVCNVCLIDEYTGIEECGGIMEEFIYCHDIACDELPYKDWRVILRVYFCPFTIKVTSSVGGDISPSGIIKTDYMSCQKFNISPAPCWHIKDVLLDGNSILSDVEFTGKNGEYNLCDIKSNHEIQVLYEKDVCYVNVKVNSGGRIEPWGKVSLICGEKRTFRIIPDNCYKISDVLFDNVSIGAVTEYEFFCKDCGNAQCEHTIEAKFEESFCNLRISSSGLGRIIMLNDINPKCGTKLKFQMIPDNCNYIKDVIVDGKSVGAVNDYEAICKGGNFEIKAIFDKLKYNIKSSSSSGGRIDPLGESNYECGSNINYRIIPGDCYKIMDVSVNGISVGAIDNYEFRNIRSEHIINATFEKLTYKISTNAQGNGIIEPNGDVLTICGENQKFIIKPNECNVIKDVIIDGRPVVIKNEYNFENIRENHSINVIFEEKTPIIKAISSIGGGIQPSGDVKIDCRNNAIFYIVPEPSYAIQDVKVDGISMGAINEFRFEAVTKNHDIEAIFRAIHSIKIQITPNGKITPSTDVRILEGEDQIFKIKPDLCYEIADVLIDGNSIGVINEYKFQNVSSDHTIKAIFSSKQYKISSISDKNGKIEPSGDVIAKCWETKSFTITPNDCYKIKDVIIDGKSFGVLSSYKFDSIRENHEIKAIFEPITYKIDVAAGDNGTTEPSGTIISDCGTNLIIFIKPNTCYKISDIIVDGSSIGAVKYFELENIRSDHSIRVNFELESYLVKSVADLGGKIEPSGDIKVLCDREQLFTIKPDPCYRILDILIDDKSIGAKSEYIFANVIDNHKIQAKFELIQYTIKAVYNVGGKIEPSGDIKAKCGDKAEFTITPDEGYVLDDVIVDGKLIAGEFGLNYDGESFTYKFDNISADHEITAKFREDLLAINETDRNKVLPLGQLKKDISKSDRELPSANSLMQNYPNPFNPETWIPFMLAKGSNVNINIYDIMGRLIKSLDLGYKDAGIYVTKSKSACWDGKDESGEKVASGIYFYAITAGDFVSIRKMTVKK